MAYLRSAPLLAGFQRPGTSRFTILDPTWMIIRINCGDSRIFPRQTAPFAFLLFPFYFFLVLLYANAKRTATIVWKEKVEATLHRKIED
jgi:hypothetical protein